MLRINKDDQQLRHRYANDDWWLLTIVHATFNDTYAPDISLVQRMSSNSLAMGR